MQSHLTEFDLLVPQSLTTLLEFVEGKGLSWDECQAVKGVLGLL